MKAAVTGFALRTPHGASLDGVLPRLLAGERAAMRNPYFPADHYPCRWAAALPAELTPRPSPHSRILPRIARMALDTAHEACAQLPAVDRARVGLFAAMGGLRASWDELLPALHRQEASFVDAWARGLKDLHPFFMLRLLSNNAHALAAQDLKLRGEGATLAGATAGAQALQAAILALHDGAVDAAVVMAYDCLIEPESVIELAAQGRLQRSPERIATSPYGAGGGSLPGEAAATLLLEPVESARASGRALALLQVAEGADGQAGLPQPETVARLLSCLAASEPLRDLFVDGCAVAGPDFDAAERSQLAGWLDGNTPLVATQAALGLLGAATPVVQTILLAALLSAGRLPPIPGLRSPAAGPLIPVVGAAAQTHCQSAIGLSVGAPGLAAAVRLWRI
jgi:3-oxoacyl-(acyl-carrier-protein) synthase